MVQTHQGAHRRIDMSYWNHNVEKMDEIIIKNLPEEWKSKVENDEIDLIDVPVNIRDQAFIEGEPTYCGDLTDHIHETLKDIRP